MIALPHSFRCLLFGFLLALAYSLNSGGSKLSNVFVVYS
jgi:hypothetical protein